MEEVPTSSIAPHCHPRRGDAETQSEEGQRDLDVERRDIAERERQQCKKKKLLNFAELASGEECAGRVAATPIGSGEYLGAAFGKIRIPRGRIP
jgi:hypothetical protein